MLGTIAGYALIVFAILIAVSSIPMAMMMAAFASDKPGTDARVPLLIGTGFLVLGLGMAAGDWVFGLADDLTEREQSAGARAAPHSSSLVVRCPRLSPFLVARLAPPTLALLIP